MNCHEVREKLSEYLAGVLSDNVSNEIKQHINNCEACAKEADEIKADLPQLKNDKQVDIEKLLKRTKQMFNFKIIKVIAVVVIIAWIIYMVPVVLWGLWSFNQPKASRALMDIVQFSQPQKANSWGNGGVDRVSMSVPLTITALPQIGKKYGQQIEFAGKMSVITGKVAVPLFFGADFVHPNLFKGADFGRDKSPKIQENILLKNAETSVATVDYSVNKLTNLQEITALLGRYDVDICWMAVEAGIENTTFKNISYKNQQALQWGIPGKLTKPGSFDYAVLNKNNADSFEKAVTEEMKWLYDNKNIIEPDSNLRYANKITGSMGAKTEIEGSYQNAIEYVIKNGIKIYGFRVTGPASELIKLSNELDLRTMSVVDMDFWNW